MTADAMFDTLVAELSLDGPVEPFLVLADHLLGQGEPWGELVAATCARTAVAAAAAERLLAEHAARLCPLAGQHGRVVSWRRGFVERVVFETVPAPRDLGRELATLFACRAARLVRHVSLASTDLDGAYVATLLGVRADLARLAVLDLEGNWFSPDVARALAQAFPNARLGFQREGSPDDLPRGLLVRSWRDD